MISFTCFEGLPLEYESFLINKYNSYITTCRYIEVYYPTYDINYMLVYENEDLLELLVYGISGTAIRCFNALAEIEQNIIAEFTKKLFEKYPLINKIEIDASYKNYSLRKSILNHKSDDHILQFPSTMEEYYMVLGSSTRQKIKNRKVRLLKDYKNAKFITKFGTDIDDKLIDEIMQLNFNKMKYKGVSQRIVTSNKNTIYKNNLYKYTQHYGCVAYIEIDGVIAAGSINTIVNKSLFGHVTAYNPNFSKYNVGELCAFYLIQTSIEKGLSTFHLLWGQSDLKKRMQAKPYVLFSYLIYRSYSFDYFFDNIKVLFGKQLKNVKQSKFSKSFKQAIRYFNSLDWKKIFSFKILNHIFGIKYSGIQDEIKV